MPAVVVRFSKSATADLEAVEQCYEEQDVPDVGDWLVREMIEPIEALSDHPEMDRLVPEFGQAFLRELIYPPLRIVYRRDAKHLRIVRNWRNQRLLELTRGEQRRMA